MLIIAAGAVGGTEVQGESGDHSPSFSCPPVSGSEWAGDGQPADTCSRQWVLREFFSVASSQLEGL